MLKKRMVLLGLLLAMSIVGQVLLRPCLGDSTQSGAETALFSQTPSAERPNPFASKTADSEPAAEMKFADDTTSLQGQLWRQFFYMIGFVALIGLGGWVVCRKFACGTAGGGQTIRISETVRLGPRKTLHLVCVGSKTLLVAGSGDNISLLADVTDSLETGEGRGDE